MSSDLDFVGAVPPLVELLETTDVAALVLGCLDTTSMAALGRASKVRRLASFHDFEEHLLAPSADEQGELVSMASYKGQVVLVENVASI